VLSVVELLSQALGTMLRQQAGRLAGVLVRAVPIHSSRLRGGSGEPGERK
jgi:hypothetical protein